MLAVEWSQGIEDAWSDLAGFGPKLIAAVVVLTVGFRSPQNRRRSSGAMPLSVS